MIGSRRLAFAAVSILAAALLAAASPSPGATNSARYRFEANKWLSLDLAADDVRTEVIKFQWPATMLGVKTGYKATVKVVNGSSHQAGIGLAVALFDEDSKMVGAGTAGTTLGTIDPGGSAEFTIDFNHLTQRLETASQFQIALEVR